MTERTRVGLVTGASSGIGERTARRLPPDAAFDYLVKGAYGMRGRSRRRSSEGTR